MARRSNPTKIPESRYGRLADLLDLATALAGSLVGLTVDDVAERYEVSTRTARRMLAALRRDLGEADLVCETDGEGHRRWRLARPAGGAAAALRFDAAELAALETAAQEAERGGRSGHARALRDALEKIRAALGPAAQRRLDPDLEVLLASEGLAMRPGPRPLADAAVVETLRLAVLGARRVELHHDHAGAGRLKKHTVSPLGFLYGVRPYLVAWSAARGRPLLFRLSRIARVLPTAAPSDAPDDFDLRDYAARSFGVFQEEPVDVVWRFSPRVAAEARDHLFHPSQQAEPQPDGSLLVRFHAGGLLEMAWHLFTWGPDVEVLEPAALRRELTRLLEQALKAHTRAPRAARRARTVRARAVRPEE